MASAGGATEVSHSYAQNHIHLVFSTKDRLKLIPPAMQPRLWAYIAGICKHHGMLAFAVGGMADHAHVLFRLPPTITLAKAVSTIKANSSSWMSEQGKPFKWQKGYAGLSVSSSNVAAVIRYIDNQEAHHRKRGFEQEFITLLKKHGIAFDPKHVFD
jgi:REP element-mobilizing transposase RayT